MKHRRQILIKDWDQEKISKISALIGGCGAIGSMTAMKLARLGVDSIIAVDPDLLEEHNLENQLYTERDLGRTKVLALKRIVREIDKEVEFIPYTKKVEGLPEKAFEADYYLSCFDNFAARFFLNAQSVFNDKPLIDAGIEGLTGNVRIIIPKKTACLECWSSLIPEPALKASCSNNPIPSTFITASHASDLQVMQMINLVFGWKVEPYIYFDLKNNICNPIPLCVNPECELCGADFNGKENWK